MSVELSEPDATRGERPDERGPFIIALGASAAHMDHIERFIAAVHPASDRAVIVVLQHREALDEAQFTEALRGTESREVTGAEDGAVLVGGRIYLCKPNTITTIVDGRFHVRPAQERPGERGTIDSLFVSLAESKAEEAIGVVLYGTGGDGTLGVSTIKDHGGLAIAERGPGDHDAHLAESQSPAALADFVLAVEEIPAHVAAYIRHLRQLEGDGFHKDLQAAAGALSCIADILRTRTGNDFHGYKQNTFLRRVQRRMQVVQIDEIGRYLEFLRLDPDEVKDLFNDLLIGVTQFFRDQREFEILEQQVVPAIFEGKTSDDQIRVWVLGCATGEEAYSIGILLREFSAKLDSPPHIQIFATDIDGRALAAARVGRYRETIEKDISPERLARWFVKEGNTYCVIKELREMCIFSQHNVLKDAPFSRLDLVSCRNLLIYLDVELQNRVIPLFHFALIPDRHLFLGNSENVSRHPKLFVPIDRRARIFKRLDTGVRLPPDFPVTTSASRVPIDFTALRVKPQDASLERRAQRIAERYAPAYVITDAGYNILHFSGRTGRFLEPTTGAASLDLLSLVHRDLRPELRSLLTRAADSREALHAEGLQIGTNGDRLTLNITVEPLVEDGGILRSFVVVFKDAVSRRHSDPHNNNSPQPVRSDHLERLEGELRETRDRLQATIEELESTNEELKPSNEEYQSLNEELQSANEELETSREELQSVNEELTTVNGELAHRVNELTRATSDLKNFLESTQIATVFLDNDMNVMNFTPTVTQVLHLVETDVGRPIQHIKAKVPIDSLYDDVRQVLRTLASVEREIATEDGRTRYIVRILPYRSIENYIAGTVMTFVDVTAITRAEERQRLLLAELQHRVRNTLGVVRSIARRSAVSSTTVEDYAMHLDGRLSAFARTQSQVTRDPEAGVDLEYLVVEELLAYQAHEGEQVLVSGPEIRLQPKAAETIGLAIHELATNAVKYGSLSRPEGRVEVRWHIAREGDVSRLIFEWSEKGGPAIDAAPSHRGFGTELLRRTLAFELKAETTIDFGAEGLTCTVQVPLTSRIVMQRDAL